MHSRHAYCSWCGTRFAAHAAWPRTCVRCQHQSYLNPLPVAVLVQPVDDGVLLIRRGEPGRGHGSLALPGGFIERGETWQHACARELFEEANISIAPETIEQFRVSSTPDGFLIVVGKAPSLREVDLPAFMPTAESLERVVVSAPQPLAFAMHEEVLRDVLSAVLPKNTFRFECDHLSIRMNSPTHRVAPRAQPLSFTQVERPPQVTSAPGHASLQFEPLHHSLNEENGKAGPLVTLVRRLRGVSSLDAALAFLAAETGVKLEASDAQLETVQTGLAATFDLVAAGWAPGNTYTFVISEKPRQTLFFSPTHWLKFDWASLTVT